MMQKRVKFRKDQDFLTGVVLDKVRTVDQEYGDVIAIVDQYLIVLPDNRLFMVPCSDVVEIIVDPWEVPKREFINIRTSDDV